jgi:type I restriction enzyme S subunit
MCGEHLTLLGQHIRLIKGVSYRKAELTPGGGAKLVNLACVRPGGGFLAKGLKDYAGKFKQEQMLWPGDVAVALTDVTQHGLVIGRPLRIPSAEAQSPLVASLDIAKIVPTSDAIDMAWLYHRLRAPDYAWHVTSCTTGTTVRHLSLADVARFQFLLPPLSEQRAIAEVLGALDDKIEANRRVAEYGRRLAIAEGIDRLAKFPGRLVALEQVATIVKGVSYRSEDLVPGGGWLVSLKCVGRDGSFQAKGLKPFSGVAKVSQFVEEGDILVAQTDLTQRAEVIGRPIRVAKLGLIGHLVASLDFVIVRPESGLTNETLFAVLSQQEFREHALGYCNGTTVLHMNSRGVPSFEFALPPPEGIAQITSVMRPLLKRSDTAQRESQLLEKLRDTLLPKLLSGELRVRDAERLVEEVV